MRKITIVVCVLIALAIVARAQDSPGLKYPNALDSPASLFEVRDNARGTLQGSLSSSATSLILSGNNIASFPDSGALTIDGREIVFYTSRVGNSFHGLVRGREGTAARTHAQGVNVEMELTRWRLLDSILREGTGNTLPDSVVRNLVIQ